MLLGEAVAAAAFTPTYSYARNYLSDLGVPVCGVVIAGRPICSPLHFAMTLGLGAHSFPFLVGFIGVAGHPAGGRRRLALGLAVLQAVGIALVLAFPGPRPADLADVTIPSHILGATAAILCGNLAILVYRWPSDLGAPGVLRWAGRWLPLAGFAAVAGLLKAQATHDFIVGDGT